MTVKQKNHPRIAWVNTGTGHYILEATDKIRTFEYTQVVASVEELEAACKQRLKFLP